MNKYIDLLTLFVIGMCVGAFALRGIDQTEFFVAAFFWLVAGISKIMLIKSEMKDE